MWYSIREGANDLLSKCERYPKLSAKFNTWATSGYAIDILAVPVINPDDFCASLSRLEDFFTDVYSDDRDRSRMRHCLDWNTINTIGPCENLGVKIAKLRSCARTYGLVVSMHTNRNRRYSRIWLKESHFGPPHLNQDILLRHHSICTVGIQYILNKAHKKDTYKSFFLCKI